jgi:hypothetical protein
LVTDMTTWTYLVVGALWTAAGVIGYFTVKARRP